MACSLAVCFYHLSHFGENLLVVKSFVEGHCVAIGYRNMMSYRRGIMSVELILLRDLVPASEWRNKSEPLTNTVSMQSVGE